jgi:hypothetical protein
MDAPLRFVALYLTTLFSLDTYAAAANSPFRTYSKDPTPVRSVRKDWGEGSSVGRRLDAAGPERPSGQLNGGGTMPVPVRGICGNGVC